MFILSMTVLTASLLGSMHCVGMCGPLAFWASGGSESSRLGAHTPRAKWVAITLYHAGRLSTYLGVGLLAGSLGSLTNISGSSLGIQLLAARIVGGAMVLIGCWQIFRILMPRDSSRFVGNSLPGKKPIGSGNLISQLMVKLRPWIMSLPLHLRGLFTGAITPFLPCGWLYLFALVAAGTGHALWGGLVMTAFWVGTVPALLVLVAGVQKLSTKFRRFVPIAAALLLIASGGTTFAGRGFANLTDTTLRDLGNSVTEKADQATLKKEDLLTEKLPCCQHESAPSGPTREQ